jgi:hypothetical protein
MYTAEISRDRPSVFLFLLDQSDSMKEPFGGSQEGISKSQGAADAMNRLLYETVMRCSKGEEVRNYFDVGVIGYGRERDWVGPVFEGDLQGRDLVPIGEVANKPAEIETREKSVPDGAGGLVKTTAKFPIWFSSVAGWNTPMCKAFEYAYGVLEGWCANNPNSFPPIVINISDGESTDGDPTSAASRLTTLSTNDGQVLLFNCHLSEARSTPVVFPDSEVGLPNEFAVTLFQISSVLPEILRNEAEKEGFAVSEKSRGFAFNADLTDLIKFLDIGTRTTNQTKDI